MASRDAPELCSLTEHQGFVARSLDERRAEWPMKVRPLATGTRLVLNRVQGLYFQVPTAAVLNPNEVTLSSVEILLQDDKDRDVMAKLKRHESRGYYINGRVSERQSSRNSTFQDPHSFRDSLRTIILRGL